MNIPEWLPYANFALNLFIIPLLKILWDIKIELTKINGRVMAAERRLDAIDRRHEMINLDRS